MRRSDFAKTVLIATFGVLVGGILGATYSASRDSGRSPWNLPLPSLFEKAAYGGIPGPQWPANQPVAPSTVPGEQLRETGETQPADDPR